MGIVAVLQTEQLEKQRKLDSYANFSQQESQDICEEVYESKGAVPYNKCVSAYNQASGLGSKQLVAQYKKYLLNGGQESYDVWKKTQLSTLTSLFGDVTNLISGKPTAQQTDVNRQDIPAPPQKMSSGAVIGLSVLGVAVIGTVIYFVTKK